MAISCVESNVASGTSVNATLAFTLGDLIFATAEYYNNSATPTVSDNVNSGNYTQLGSTQNDGQNHYVSFFYKIVNVSSVTVPTISDSGSGADHIGFTRFTGFVLGATIVTADNSVGTNTGTSISSGTVNASENSEGFWGTIFSNGQAATITDAFFFQKASGGYVSQCESVDNGLVSSGTNVAMTASLGASQTWIAFIQGFYDASPPPTGVPVAWFR